MPVADGSPTGAVIDGTEQRVRLRDEGYALITAENAGGAAERGKQAGQRLEIVIRILAGSPLRENRSLITSPSSKM